jgi:uncharacterized protein (DUF952 family)
MKIIVIISTADLWAQAQKQGTYTKSTIDSDVSDVGFIHCTSPDQTIATANRHFNDKDDIVLLLIDADKVTVPVKFESAVSGRPGLFPHIYGPLNTDAVFRALPLAKDRTGQFIEPEGLQTHTT